VWSSSINFIFNLLSLDFYAKSCDDLIIRIC
jgi:hypothetical protein